MTNELNIVELKSKLPGIEQSIFSYMTALANEYQAINLAQGFPDFNCDEQLIDYVSGYMKKGFNQYAPMPGILSLREKIAEKVKKIYGSEYNPDTEITITAGATQAIYNIITTCVNIKDEVIILEPAYDCYIPAVQLNKGIPKYMELTYPNYNIDWETFKKMISSKTKLIIINNPHNPSGSTLKADDLVQLEKIVAGKDIFILSDEVYEHINFNDRHLSLASYPELKKRTFIVSSFGKTYHTTGWKVGYVLAPSHLTQEFRKIHSYSMFSVNTPIQYAYNDFIGDESKYLELSNFYKQKRDLFRQGLENSKFKLLPCSGGYFQLADYSEISQLGDREFAEYLTKEVGVACIPVSVFYHHKKDDKVVRFCFAKNDETLQKATEKLCRI
jgi:methionine aminotransferase